MKRLFVAFPVTRLVRNRLALWVSHQKTPDKVKWVDPFNYHVTLVFLGATDPTLIKDIEQQIEEAVEPLSPMDFRFSRLAFKPSGKPHLIWAQWEAPRVAEHLHLELCRRLINPDYVPKRPWIAHTTLARFRHRPANVSVELDEVPVLFVDTVVLYESILHQKGAEYRKLKTIPLK